MKKNIEQFVKLIIYLTFFVPLVVVPASFIFPFIVPKILLLRSLTLVAAGGYIILLLINFQEYKPKLNALNIAILLFLVSFVISTFVGVDPYHSFWDNHERMLGLFTITHYILFYFICSAIFKKWEDWQWALRIFLSAGSLVMFIGILQIFKPDLLLNGGSDRVASTLGNSVYVGGYGLFLSFVAALLVIKEKAALWRYGALVGGIMALVGIIYSGSRGALFGFLVGAAFAVLLYSFMLKGHTKIRKGIWVGGGAIVILAVILFLNRGSAFVQRVPAVDRLLNTSYAQVTNSARFLAWEAAIKSWEQKPVFGWGPNNFFYAFNQNYDPRSLNFGYGETWFDNAHNIIVNTLAVQGTVGLLTYLAIFVSAWVLLFRGYKRGLDVHVVIIGGAFLLGHLVQNVTVFENPTSYLYFMFWLALVNRLTTNATALSLVNGHNTSVNNGANASRPSIYAADKKISWAAIGGVGVVVVALIFVFDFQPAKANQQTLDALRMLNSGKINIEDLKKATSFASPHIDDIRSDLGKGVGGLVLNYQNKVTTDTKDQLNQLLDFSIKTVEPNLTLHPLDIRNQMLLAQLEQSKAIINNDASAMQQAETYLTQALEHSPKRQQILFILAQTKLQLGKTDDAIKLLQQTVDLNTSVAESYWRLAYTYGLTGNIAKAEETLKLIKDRNIHLSDQEKQIISDLENQLKQVKSQTPSVQATPVKSTTKGKK